ncbi:MAG: amidohydrolase family protein, partial [Burkholderiales bacterium]
MSAVNIPGPITPTRTPSIRLPTGSCDCHAHVFGPRPRFEVVANTHYVPPDCLLPDYLGMLGSIGCSRGVLVQPSVYGTDNTAIAEALATTNATKAFELRAVAVVDSTITDGELERLHALGFRGVRINIASTTPGLTLTDAPRLAARIKPLGWHLQLYADFRTSPTIETELARLDIDIVIDHF